MVKKKTTIEDIMKELKTIKKLVLRDLQIDVEDVKIDKKGLGVHKTALKSPKRIFKDVTEWREHIWEDCPRKEMISKEEEFDYYCELLKKTCNYKTCPLNIRRQ